MSNNHPLEDVFNTDLETSFKFEEDKVVEQAVLELGASLVDPNTGELVTRPIDIDAQNLDREERLQDLHNDAHLEQIRVAAFQAFEAQHRMSQEADPRFSARNAEVALQALNLSLNAVKEKVEAKFKRQKIRIAKQEAKTPTTVNNNVIVADRNELLKQLRGIAPTVEVVENEPKK